MGTVFIKLLKMCFGDKDQCSFRGPKSRYYRRFDFKCSLYLGNLLITKHVILKPFHFHVVYLPNVGLLKCKNIIIYIAFTGESSLIRGILVCESLPITCNCLKLPPTSQSDSHHPPLYLCRNHGNCKWLSTSLSPSLPRHFQYDYPRYLLTSFQYMLGYIFICLPR